MKFYILIIVFFISFSVLSQPNPGFEDWELEFGQESPVGWQTLNFLSAFPNNLPSALKVSGIDKHSGNYALKIRSIEVVTNPAPSVIDDTMGAAFIGKINISPLYLKPGYPYTGRPEMMQVWYKYFPLGDDRGTAGALLTKWNGLKRDTIAKADSIIGYNPTYSLLQLKLDYYSDEFPDSAIVLFSPSRHDETARVNSTLFVDDVEFSGWVGIDESTKNKKEDIRIFPNPAKNRINIVVKNPINDATFQIINSSGKIIDSQKLNVLNTEINTEIYPSGVYFYRIVVDNKGVIDSGKFTVVK